MDPAATRGLPAHPAPRPARPARWAGWTGRHTRRRRAIQLAFLAVFAVLPLLDLVRFDFPARKLHFFRGEIWLDEWTILWLALMLGMWLVGAATLVLGRVYCAYACPQTIFSELAHDVDALARRLSRPIAEPRRTLARGAMRWALIGLLSLAATVLFLGYFSPLSEVLSRLARLDVSLWLGAVGAITTGIGILNLLFVREGFCRAVCPYGLLQGILEDGRSLHVAFDESTGKCIDCAACARVCPMAIDIREGSFQIECTRCGSCADACAAVLGRRKRPSLLAFRMGSADAASPWDLKRFLVTGATGAFAAALLLAVAVRQPITLHLAPVYTESTAQIPGVAEARYLLRAANRGHEAVPLGVTAVGLPPGSVLSGAAGANVAPGREQRFTLVVRLPRSAIGGSVLPFELVVKAGSKETRFASTFFAPSGGRKPS